MTLDKNEATGHHAAMRMLLLNHNLRGRGTWHRAWQFARELARRGHEITLWTAAPHHYYRHATQRRERVRIVETPSWAPLADGDDGWGPLDVLWRGARVLFEPFDVCYAFAHPPNVWWPAWLARRLRRRPLLYDWCDWYEGGIFPKRMEMRREGLIGPGERPLQRRIERWEIGLERRMLRMAGRVTVISNTLMDLARRAGRREDELLLMPNGADLDRIQPTDPVRCRAELGLEATGPYLAYASNYHPDQEMLLRALAHTAERHPNVRLILAGPPFAESLVRELNVGERIVNLGRIDPERVSVALGAADALVLPLEDNASNRARVPYKFTDYLAAGRPIVTNRVGDLERWFPDQPPYDGAIGLAGAATAEGLGDAMGRILECDDDRRRTMGFAARRLAETEFSWPVLVDRLEAFMNAWLKSENRSTKSETNSKSK